MKYSGKYWWTAGSLNMQVYRDHLALSMRHTVIVNFRIISTARCVLRITMEKSLKIKNNRPLFGKWLSNETG
jgi:hypothetical protein